MIKAGVGYSRSRSTALAIEKACRMALEEGRISKANFGFVFSTIDHCKDPRPLLTTVRQLTGAQSLAGASGFGVFTNNMEAEKTGGLAVLLVESDTITPSSFIFPNLQENNLEAGKKIGRLLKNKAQRDSLLTLFPDPLSLFSESMFEGIEQEMGTVPIIGGNAGEDGTRRMTFQWNEENSGCDSVAGMFLTGEFSSLTAITQSCVPMGEPMKVTKVKDNVIYELNDKPALDVLLEILAELRIEDLESASAYVFIGIPVCEGENGKVNYLVRNILGMEVQARGLVIGATLREGDYLFFALREPGLSKKDLEEMLQEIKPEVEKQKPRFGFYFNCCARGSALYGGLDVDRLTIREKLGDIPLIGFFTYGEIAPIGNRNYIHNFTGVLTLIGD